MVEIVLADGTIKIVTAEEAKVILSKEAENGSK